MIMFPYPNGLNIFQTHCETSRIALDEQHRAQDRGNDNDVIIKFLLLVATRCI